MKNPLRTFIDWYVRIYHAEDYIHISEIKYQILSRIENALERNNNDWTQKMEALELKLKREYTIIENGYLAEIESMEKITKDTLELKSNVEKLDFIVKAKAHEIVLLTAEIKEERKNFINSNSATMGTIDNFIIKSEKLLVESKEEKQLREKI